MQRIARLKQREHSPALLSVSGLGTHSEGRQIERREHGGMTSARPRNGTLNRATRALPKTLPLVPVVADCSKATCRCSRTDPATCQGTDSYSSRGTVLTGAAHTEDSRNRCPGQVRCNRHAAYTRCSGYVRCISHRAFSRCLRQNTRVIASCQRQDGLPENFPFDDCRTLRSGRSTERSHEATASLHLRRSCSRGFRQIGRAEGHG